MKVGLLVIAFNVDQWIYQMLENASKYVDIAYIAYPSRPWNYSEKARNQDTNPTILDEDRLSKMGINYKLIKGDWAYDEDTRNAIREVAASDSCDWLVVQDADEFYDNGGWNRLKDLMKEHLGEDVAIATKWLNFWKNTDYVIVNRDGGLTSSNECAALSLSGSSFFSYSRTVSCNVIDSEVVCYHLGYVMNDAQANMKVRTWAHTGDVDIGNWYGLKWQGWHPGTKYLHPGNPPVWDRAVRTPAHIVLPPECKIFSELEMGNTLGSPHRGKLSEMSEHFYDLRALTTYRLKQVRGKSRAFIKGLFRK